MISLQKRFLSPFILSVALIFSCNTDQSIEKAVDVNPKNDSLFLLVSQYPDSIQLQLALQEKIYAAGDTSKALSNLIDLMTKFPENPALYNAVSVIYVQQTDTARAIASLLQSLAINQQQPDIEFELAFLQAAQKNRNALAIADRLIHRYEDPTIQAKGHFTKGIYFANQEVPKQAIKEFDSAIIKNFTSVDAYIEKSILLLELNNAHESIATLTKAIALDKNNADILFWLGKAFQQKKEYDQALLYFSETLKIDPNNLAAEQAIKEIKNN